MSGIVRDVPELDLADPALAADPFMAYAAARERSPLARLTAPGMPPMWAVTRHATARAMLGDPTFALDPASYAMRPTELPAECLDHMHTMQEMEGAEHARLRRLVAPAFTARQAERFRPRIVPIVDRLLDEIAAAAGQDGGVDLLAGFARPLPTEVICELVGIDPDERASWREYGAAVAAGNGPAFVAAIPRIIADAKAAVARRREQPADDVISDLLRAQAEDGDRLSDTELVTLVWQLLLAGQVPTNLVVNAVEALLGHPEQLALLRATPEMMPGAVEELTRYVGPQLLTIPRFAWADVVLDGVRIATGDAVTVSIAAVNRDPRVFPNPDRLDVTRSGGRIPHLGYAHGPHFCLGAALARVEVEVALSGLIERFPELAATGEVHRVPDPGTWRASALPVRLGDA